MPDKPKEPKATMNAQERAEKICRELHPNTQGYWALSWFIKHAVPIIAAQITEAEREAKEMGYCTTHALKRKAVCTLCVVDAAFRQGFLAAKEKAAGLVENPINPDYETDDQLRIRARLASMIRAMSPTAPGDPDK